MNGDFNNSFGQRITPEMAKTNEDMQYIAMYGQQAFNEFKSRQMNTAERMRLRDEFAMAAPEVPDWFLPAGLQQLIKNKDNKGLADRFFEWRYFYADQMLKAREVKP